MLINNYIIREECTCGAKFININLHSEKTYLKNARLAFEIEMNNNTVYITARKS